MNIRFAARAVTIALFVAGGVALAGCGDKCAGVYCAPCNVFMGDIVVVFDRDSLRGGFRKAEIDGGYAVRYAPPGFITPIDTVRQARNGADFYHGFVSLGTLPWPGLLTGAATKSLEAYNYRFVLPALNRTYDLSNVELQTGPGNTKSCCNCGENVRRRFTLNGVPIVLDGNENNENPAVLGR